MRTYVTENTTLPIFPSWLLGSSMRVKDFLNAISYSSYHVGRHADFLVLWMPCAGRTCFSVIAVWAAAGFWRSPGISTWSRRAGESPGGKRYRMVVSNDLCSVQDRNGWSVKPKPSIRGYVPGRKGFNIDLELSKPHPE